MTEAAAEELSAWAEELSDSELAALRDPRNWLRPARPRPLRAALPAARLMLIEIAAGASARPVLAALADQVRSRGPG